MFRSIRIPSFQKRPVNSLSSKSSLSKSSSSSSSSLSSSFLSQNLTFTSISSSTFKNNKSLFLSNKKYFSTNSDPKAHEISSTIDSSSSSSSSYPPSKFTEENTPNLFGSQDGHFEEAQLAPGDTNRRTYTYLILGSARFIAASAVRAVVIRFVSYLSAPADVLALGSLDVDVAAIPMGSTFTIKWRGKPVFIRHRTPDEIALANSVSLTELKHPETDSARVKDPNFLIVVGVCTHLGCVPMNNAGDYKGWFCPCHGSHYDTSGRIRKGPAPFNLEVPPYKFLSDTKILLG